RARALLRGVGVAGVADLPAIRQPGWLRWTFLAVVVLAAAGQPLFASRAVLFELTPVQVSRFIYGRNPFPESVEVARYIRERSAPGDRIAVVGSEPQIYFYAHRRSAT